MGWVSLEDVSERNFWTLRIQQQMKVLLSYNLMVLFHDILLQVQLAKGMND